MARQYEAESRFSGRFRSSVFDTLKLSYRPVAARSIAFLTIGLLGRGLLLANANIIGYWVDSFCKPSAAGACRPVPGLFAGLDSGAFLKTLCLATLLGYAMTLFFRMGFARLSARAISLLYDEVTLRTSRLPMGFFDSNPVGRIITRFSTDYNNVFRMFGGPLTEFCGIIFDLCCMAFLISVASPYYLPVCLSIAGLNYSVYRLNRESLRRERRELSASRSPSIAHFAETVQGASTIRAYLRQKSFFERFNRLNLSFLNQRLRTTKFILGFSFQMNAVTALMLFATGLAAYWLVSTGRASVGSVGVAFAFVTLSGNSTQLFFEWMSQFEEALTGVERLDDYLRRPLEPGLALPTSARFATGHPLETRLPKQPASMGLSARLAIEDLWFRYRPDLPHVLTGIRLEVAPGEKLGIVGRTGSGKTSLIQAIFHLYPIDRGRVLLDGLAPVLDLAQPNSADGISLKHFRQKMSLISQDPTLFRGTLRENLGSGEEGLLDSKMLEALDRVGMGGRALDARIEERGRNLSLGERQLICMARCLLQKAPVVVMDEATSAIDPQSEKLLVRATREFFSDRTQLIIAHRLSTLEGCDRILWLHQGEIRALGQPEEVIREFERSQLMS